MIIAYAVIEKQNSLQVGAYEEHGGYDTTFYREKGSSISLPMSVFKKIFRSKKTQLKERA